MEMRQIEEQRLEESNTSRAPLFGVFDAFEPPHLIIDAIMRARSPVPIIPLTYTIPQQEIGQFQPSQQHNYQQVFENCNYDINQNCSESPQIGDSVFNLMAKLKERGLIGAEQLASSSDNDNPMQQPIINQSWTQSNGKLSQMCTYFVNKPSGCRHGDSCKYEHNNEERERRQTERQNQYSRNESWRPRQSRMMSGKSNNRKRGFRSRSP
uniref:C3H1-type domain-containing protein n=1 Tax=Caenorhabditis tropicalis TaxID=1561998 RepID=A0A1I7V4X1_9PELO